MNCLVLLMIVRVCSYKEKKADSKFRKRRSSSSTKRRWHPPAQLAPHSHVSVYSKANYLGYSDAFCGCKWQECRWQQKFPAMVMPAQTPAGLGCSWGRSFRPTFATNIFGKQFPSSFLLEECAEVVYFFFSKNCAWPRCGF